MAALESRIVGQPERRSWVATWLAVYLAFLLFGPAFMQDLTFVSRGVKVDQIMLILTFPVLVLVRPINVWKSITSPIGMSLFIFFLLALVSGTISFFVSPAVSLGTIIAAVWGQARPWLVFVVVYAFVRGASIQFRKKMLVRLAWLTAGVFVIVLLQYLQIQPVSEYVSMLYGRRSTQDAIALALAAGRVYGTFDGQSNTLGTFAMMVLALSLPYYLQTHGKQRWYLVALVAGSVFSLAVSWSRGAFAGAVMVLLANLLRQRGNGRLLTMSIGLGSIFYALLPDTILERFSQLLTLRSYGGSAIYATRLPYWEENIRYWASSPLFGVLGMQVAPFDSLYIALLTTNGLIGSAAFCITLALCTAVLGKLIRRSPPHLSLLSFGTMTVMGGLLVNGISAPTFFSERVQEFFWMLVAFTIAPCPDTDGGKNHYEST